MTAARRFPVPPIPTPADLLSLLTGSATEVAGDVIGRAFDAILGAVAEGVAFVCGKLIDAVAGLDPKIDGSAFADAYTRPVAIALLLAVAALIIGVGIGAATGRVDIIAGSLWRYTAYTASFAVLPGIASLMVSLADAATAGLTVGQVDDMSGAFSRLVSSMGVTGQATTPVAVSLIFGTLALVAGLVLAVTMVVRGAALLALVYFAPLALVAAIAGRDRIARRMAETFVAFLLIKPVCFGALALGVRIIDAEDGWSAMLAGTGLLVCAMFAPALIFSLVHSGDTTSPQRAGGALGRTARAVI